jgi:hypothetical protein
MIFLSPFNFLLTEKLKQLGWPQKPESRHSYLNLFFVLPHKNKSDATAK